jgi:hypothetical protein
VHREYTANSSCSGLKCPREPFPGRCAARREIPSPQSAGSPFYAIIGKPSPIPTITFSVLYGFFIIGHDRRQILHFNVTWHPTSAWIVQQLREAFPFQTAPKYLIFDRDAKYGREVPLAAR